MLLSRCDFLLFWQKNDSEVPFLPLRSLRGRSKRCAPQVLKSCYKSLQSKHAEAFCFIHERHGLTRKLKTQNFGFADDAYPNRLWFHALQGRALYPFASRMALTCFTHFSLCFHADYFTQSRGEYWATEAFELQSFQERPTAFERAIGCIAWNGWLAMRHRRSRNFVFLKFGALETSCPSVFFVDKKRFADMALYGWQGPVGTVRGCP